MKRFLSKPNENIFVKNKNASRVNVKNNWKNIYTPYVKIYIKILCFPCVVTVKVLTLSV